MKLNLGCGEDYKEGYINVDNNPEIKADKYFNFEDIFPLKDNSFEYIHANLVIEHLDDFFKVMKELKRILTPNGILHIRVPHFSNGLARCDITHKHEFSYFTFDKLKEWKIVEKRLNFITSSKILNRIMNFLFNHCNKKIYEKLFCWIFPVNEIELKPMGVLKK